MSRPDRRWWRPSTTRRPAQRARARRMFTEQEMGQTFDVGYRCGQLDGRKNGRVSEDPTIEPDDLSGAEVIDLDLEELRRAQEADPERFHQIAEAVREGGDAVRRLAREWGFNDEDDLMDVAEEAGATPLADVDPGQIVVEIEAWLRERGRGE